MMSVNLSIIHDSDQHKFGCLILTFVSMVSVGWDQCPKQNLDGHFSKADIQKTE